MGAALTHKQLLEQASKSVASIGISEADKLCITSPSPLGVSVGSIAACQSNAPLVFATSDVDEERTNEVVATEGVTKVVQAL